MVTACSLAYAPAVVLGSTQPHDVVDADRAAEAGLDVVRRGTGGGAVLVVPGGQAWLDLWLPRGDPLWDDDVIRSTRWLGDAWARALGTLGVAGLDVHTGRAVCTSWSSLVCFAGVGPGEVTLRGAKVVGIAQRRTREGARWHASVALSWEPARLATVLALDERRAALAPVELAEVATGLRTLLPTSRDVSGYDLVTAVEDALVNALP
jgi:lipoate-protein ligase A